MAEPITWRNVTGGSDGSNTALRGIVGAGIGINDGFKAFQDVIAKTAAIDSSNQAAQIEGMKQNFLNTLQSARTPEELAAAQATVQSQFAALPVAVQAQVRGAEEARTSALRNNVTAQQSYDEGQAAVAARPLVRSLEQEAVQGNVGAIQTALQANPNLPQGAKLLSDAQAAARAKVTQSQADTRYNQDVQKFGFEIANARRDSELKDISLEETRQRVADNTQVRNAFNVVGDLSNRYKEATANARAEITNEARELGLEIPATGIFNPATLEASELKRLNESLKSKGKPLATTLMNGDTAAAQEARDRIASMNLRPDQRSQIEAVLPTAFTTTPMGRIGSDAATQEYNNTIQEQIQEANEGRYGIVANPRDQEGLLKHAREIVNSLNEDDSTKERYMRDIAGFLLNDGIRPVDSKGKPTGDRIVPSKELLGQLITNRDRGWVETQWNNTMEERLKAWKESPEAVKGASVALEGKMRQRISKVQKKAE